MVSIGGGSGRMDPDSVKNEPSLQKDAPKQARRYLEPEFKGVFRRIDFAIIDDQNSNGNFAKFEKEFNGFSF